MSRRRARPIPSLVTLAALPSVAPSSSAGEVTIEGLVTDRSGAPITSATLGAWECRELLDLDPPEDEFTTIVRATVDEQGRYRLSVPIRYDHGLAVVVRSTGRAPGVVWLSREDLQRGALEVHPLALRLARAPVVPAPGRVVDPLHDRPVKVRLLDLGEPLAGARVRLVGATHSRIETGTWGACVVFVAGDEPASIEVEADVRLVLDEGRRARAHVRATVPLSGAAEQTIELRPGGGWVSGLTNQWELQARPGTIRAGGEGHLRELGRDLPIHHARHARRHVQAADHGLGRPRRRSAGRRWHVRQRLHTHGGSGDTSSREGRRGGPPRRG